MLNTDVSAVETTELANIRAEISRCSELTEVVYTRLGSIFPSLLSIVSENDPSASLPSLRELLSRIKESFAEGSGDTTDYFDALTRRNTRLFSELAVHMKALNDIHTRLEAIRSNSEELELISLNAMVISIKSGEKGRAFSCITENLKRLSASMITLSNELMLEEKKLIRKNTDLEQSFTETGSRRDEVLLERKVSLRESIFPVLTGAWDDLKQLDETASTTVRPIRQAMNGIQLQDIVRQSIDQVLLATGEILPPEEQSGTEEQLDRISVDVQLLEICERIINDVHANVEKSVTIFTENWEEVHRILDTVEDLRRGFLATYLDYGDQGGRSLPALLDQAAQSFSGFISRITVFQREQKSIVSDSTSIVTEVKYLRTLFETIRPIIARLQHVRITQQIEVAKNEALHSVRGTVDYMSDLIYRTEASVEETRQELEAFIESIEVLINMYRDDSRTDSRELDQIKEEKSVFFKTMQEENANLTAMLSDLRVYPDSFQTLCTEVDESLKTLRDTAYTLETLKKAVSRTAGHYRTVRESLLEGMETDSWVIKNDRLRALVERFTITAHKEAAGEIGGFDVDGIAGGSVESGDVTLFF